MYIILTLIHQYSQIILLKKYMQKNGFFFHVNLKLRVSPGPYIIIKLLIELSAHV